MTTTRRIARALPVFVLLAGGCTRGGVDALYESRWAGVAHAAGPEGWTVATTGPAQTGADRARWVVRHEADAPGAMPGAAPGASVMALTEVGHESTSTFNLCLSNAARFKDGTFTVHFRADAGQVDQGGGPVWRVVDADNYYICRANPLEENFRLYVVKDGKRTQLASIDAKHSTGMWHAIEVTHAGERIRCVLDGRAVVETTDETLPAEGGVGVWTKADARTSFVVPAQWMGGMAAAGAASGAPGAHGGGMVGKSSHVEPPLNWIAKPTSVAPEIDGEIDAAWSGATPLVVTVREAVGAGSPRTVKLRALHTANPPMLSVLAEWEDDTKSDRRDPYIWNPETMVYDRPTRSDDQFALEFPISGEFDVNMLAMGKTYTADVWHWKAGRGGPIGYVDDKRHIISATPMEKANEYSFGPHGKVSIQRPMDAGTPAYTVKPKPTIHEGGEVDSFVQQQPSGSVADIRGKATHNGRRWTLEMARRLDTGNADDAVISAGGVNPCAIAILDDELYWHHSVSSLIHLTLAKE